MPRFLEARHIAPIVQGERPGHPAQRGLRQIEEGPGHVMLRDRLPPVHQNRRDVHVVGRGTKPGNQLDPNRIGQRRHHDIHMVHVGKDNVHRQIGQAPGNPRLVPVTIDLVVLVVDMDHVHPVRERCGPTPVGFAERFQRLEWRGATDLDRQALQLERAKPQHGPGCRAFRDQPPGPDPDLVDPLPLQFIDRLTPASSTAAIFALAATSRPMP